MVGNVGSGGTESNAVTKYKNTQASLDNSETQDSGWIDTSGASKVRVFWTALANIDFEIQSTDADDQTSQLTTPVTYTGASYFISIQPRQKWMRFLRTNNTGSAVTNAIMNIHLIYGGVDGASVFPIEIPPAIFSPAMLVQSVMRGKDPFDNFQSVGVNEAGALLQSDFGTEVARGLYSGYEIVRKFGRNPDIDTGTTPEDVYNGGGTTTAFNATANEGLRVLSSSAQDAGTLVSSGTSTSGTSTTLTDSGATFVSDGVAVNDIVLLDDSSYHGFVKSLTETELTVYHWLNGDTSNFTASSGESYRVATTNGTGAAVIRVGRLTNIDMESQTAQYIIMNGTSAVTRSGDFARASTARVVKAGSNGKNVGEITCTQATTTSVVYFVMPTFGRTTVGGSTIPAGKNGILKKTEVAITRANGSAGSGTVVLYVRERGSNAWSGLQVFEVQTGSAVQRKNIGGDIMLGGTDFKFTVENVSDGNTVCEIECEYFLVDES